MHPHFPIGLSTAPNTLEAFTHISGWFTHTGSFHIISYFPSFPLHSPSSISFLFLRLRISNAAPVPYIQSRRLQFPASVHTFAKPGRAIQETASFSYDMQLFTFSHSSTSTFNTIRAPRLLALSTGQRGNVTYISLWQERQGRRQQGGKICKWPWDSDFL